MAITLEDLAALEKAYASGVRSTEIDGEEVEFTSGPDMRQRILWIKRELGLSTPKTGRSVAEFGKGIR